MTRLLTCLVCVVGATLLASCTERPTIYIDNLSFVVSEAPEYTKEISLVSMLRLDFSADIDIHIFTEERGMNLWYKIHTCESKKEIARWSWIYKNLDITDYNDSEIYHYSVFFDYKNTALFQDFRTYNLVDHPEDLCVQIGGGRMWGLSRLMKSNIVVVEVEMLVRALKSRGQTR